MSVRGHLNTHINTKYNIIPNRQSNNLHHYCSHEGGGDDVGNESFLKLFRGVCVLAHWVTA